MLVAAAAVLAGCSGEHREAPRPPRLDAAERYERAFPVVASFLHAVSSGRSTEGWAAPRTEAERRSLVDLTRRVSAIPAGRLTVETARLDLPGDAGMGVVATLSAELGPAPSTAPVLLGQVALAARPDAEGRWWVVADVSGEHERVLNRSGVLSLPGVRWAVGSSSVVVDATRRRELSYGALVARSTVDAELPRLRARYGGGPERALVAIVPDRRMAELVMPGVGRVDAVALAWQGRVVLEDAGWTSWGNPGAQAVLVHELTHLVTERWMAGAPTSLAEGLAQEEQDRYLRYEGSFMRFDALSAAYRDDYPTLRRWQAGTAGWRLADSGQVGLAYADGQAMVHAVLTRHGGLRALRRLAARFAQLGGPAEFDAADVRRAFRAALGVPFAAIAREARAWVVSGAWRPAGGSAT